MNYKSSFKRFTQAKGLAAFLIGTTLAWALGLPMLFNTVSAAQLDVISATASSSAPTVATNYTLQYSASSTATAGQTITITFSPLHSGGTDEFDLTGLVAGDILVTGWAVVANVGACGAPTNEAYVTSINNVSGDRSITYTVCGSDTITAGTKTLQFTNNHVTNPTTVGSYIVRFGGTWADHGDTRVAIVNAVTVTASVDTTLTFTISGVASSTVVNGETTSTTTSATAIGFGTLASGTPVVGAQQLAVTTNARNGFIVTVKENQNLLSNNGADINVFKDQSGVATPAVWAAPTAVLGSPDTYGHLGLTSNDTDLNGGEFSGTKYAGNFATTSRVVFSNSGPADGTTQDKGLATVAYKIQISALQEAAADYTNTLTYVCTPTF